jgi:hypothetical protein
MRKGGIDTHNLAESAVLEQRAWLGAGDETYSITETGPVTSTTQVTNFGKTPAMDVVSTIAGATKARGDGLTYSDLIYPTGLQRLKSGTIFPTQHFPTSAGGPPMDPQKQKQWFANVANTVWIQYFYGEIHYRDIFGKEHWTHFCTQYVPGTKGGTPCPIYNDTDDDKDLDASANSSTAASATIKRHATQSSAP